MKKKISVFALLLSLLLAVPVPAAAPVPAQAANSTETDENGVLVDACLALKEDSEFYSMLKTYPYVIGKTSELECDYMLMIYTDSDPCVIIKGMYEYSAYFLAGFKSDGTRSYGKCYKYVNGMWEYVGFTNRSFKGSGSTYPEILLSCFDIIYDRSGNILYEDIKTFFDFVDGYNFGTWCKDAGLNCQASSNESDSVIPYSYNDYWHIVRRTNNEKWLLTTIGNSKDMKDMYLRLSEDLSKLIIYNVYEDDGTDSAVNGFLAHVRQYEYDTDGWKLRSYNTYDVRDFDSDIIELEVGSAFDDTRLLAFTNTDIFSFNGYAVYYAASTEYYEVTDTPTVTPEPTPGSGSSGSDDSGSSGSGSSGGGRPGTGTRPSVGGEASGGGGLDFIISLFTLIWTKICAVPMSVDGYSISLQQLFVYGALVSIVGGFIMKFIFRR